MALDDIIVEKEIEKEMRVSHDVPGRPSADDDVERGQPSPGPQQGAHQIPSTSKCATCGQPTSGVPPRDQSLQLKRYLDAEVTTNHADALMLVCCVISGFVDSTIYHGE